MTSTNENSCCTSSHLGPSQASSYRRAPVATHDRRRVALPRPRHRQRTLRCEGTLYELPRTFVQTYCSSCQWSAGRHAKQPIAYAVFQVDTYDLWVSGHSMVSTVLDKWNSDGILMPPP